MPSRAFSRLEREAILHRYYETLDARRAVMERQDYDAAAALLKTARRIKEDYFQHIPRVIVSCCPFDGKPLVRTFDPFGLDGLWWKPDQNPQELPACPHICVVRGAVHFRGLPPRGGHFQALPGPEVPHIIPRLLEYPGMVAVVSQLEMECGYAAYPIAYFAERRPPVAELTADWPRDTYSYETETGELGWTTPNDPWDFDLRPWLQAGKIRWCDPDSDRTSLSDAPPDQCPYVDLPGLRERMMVKGDVSWTAGLPEGEDLDPCD